MKINTSEILGNIMDSTSSAFTDGYDTEKILLIQDVYEAFKDDNEKLVGVGKGDFNKLLCYPVEVNNNIDGEYMIVIKEIN